MKCFNEIFQIIKIVIKKKVSNGPESVKVTELGG